MSVVLDRFVIVYKDPKNDKIDVDCSAYKSKKRANESAEHRENVGYEIIGVYPVLVIAEVE